MPDHPRIPTRRISAILPVWEAIVPVWEEVSLWPADLRRSLATRILQSLQDEPQARGETVADLVGLLASDQTPPTDEEVEQILEEERARRLG